MNGERFVELLWELAEAAGIDPEEVANRGTLEVDGFDVRLDYYDSDPEAMYLNFDFGVVEAGRTLTVFRLLLEANLSIYAQDQAQMGLLPDQGNVLLVVRVNMGEDIDGAWLVDTIVHYVEHGKYWRQSILEASDEMFESVASGQCLWLRA